jgi:hypothetical protein
VWAEASPVLWDVAADFLFNCSCLEIPSDKNVYESYIIFKYASKLKSLFQSRSFFKYLGTRPK